jgi:hypothetical protein
MTAPLVPRGIRLGIETLRSLIFSSISGTYFAIVNVATQNPVRVMCFTNLTNSNLFVAISPTLPASDGTADDLIVPANGFKLVDVTTNRYDNLSLELPAGNIFWARTATGSSNPTSGFIYAEVFYGY